LPTISAPHWPPRQRSIFATLTVTGSADQTKIPTDCCANIFRVAPICPCIVRQPQRHCKAAQMKGREKPCSARPHLRSSQNVLQRSVELAPR
jgi:hypothetical protein